MRKIAFADMIRSQKKDLKRQEKAWISAGGRIEHFRYIYQFEVEMKSYYQHGPIGYGGIPDGCKVEEDVVWIKDGALIKRHRSDISGCRDAMFEWMAKWCAKNDVKSEYIHCSRYLELWSYIAIQNKKFHKCWEPDNSKVDLGFHRFAEYMRYLFQRGIGMPKVDKIERMLKAIGMGYWPIGYDGETPIVLRCKENHITTIRRCRKV